MARDITEARFWAISGIGYGKGFTPGEAIENYVATQLRNMPAKSTIYGTPKKWEAALRTGDAKAIVWFAPKGTTGFALDGALHWKIGDEFVDVEISQRLEQEFLEQVEDDHPEHTECADGCGLAVTHQGACLDKPGGRQVCHHEED